MRKSGIGLLIAFGVVFLLWIMRIAGDIELGMSIRTHWVIMAMLLFLGAVCLVMSEHRSKQKDYDETHKNTKPVITICPRCMTAISETATKCPQCGVMFEED